LEPPKRLGVWLQRSVLELLPARHAETRERRVVVALLLLAQCARRQDVIEHLPVALEDVRVVLALRQRLPQLSELVLRVGRPALEHAIGSGRR
jgi:hypothetical protein